MEELRELCEHGAAAIRVARDWEHLSEAREFLTSQGYVEQQGPQIEEDEGDDSVVFHRESPLPKAECFQFPKTTPEPRYESKVERSNAAPTEWTILPAYQYNSLLEPDDSQLCIFAKTPKHSLKQTVAVIMQIQPAVHLDNAHFNVKLQVTSLLIGVHKSDLLKPDEHHGFGFYPYSIRIDMEPLVDGNESLIAVPTVESPVEHSFPASFSSFCNEIGVEVGFGPVKANASRSWGREIGETEVKKTAVVRINELDPGRGNAASFEWRLLRWMNEERYEVNKPERGFKWTNGISSRQLPFEGFSVSLEKNDIPEVHWKLARKVKAGMVSFRIRVQMEMHLVWWRNNRFIKSAAGSLADSCRFENVWKLEQDVSSTTTRRKKVNFVSRKK